MTKSRRTEGPHVALAAFCENVLEEKDGVLSLVRVIDRTVIQRRSEVLPLEQQPVSISITLVVGLKAGAARGSHELRVMIEAPDGQSMGSMLFPVLFESEDRGVNLILRLTLVARCEGVYWFDLLMGERRLTRVPYRIIVQRLAVE